MRFLRITTGESRILERGRRPHLFYVLLSPFGVILAAFCPRLFAAIFMRKR